MPRYDVLVDFCSSGAAAGGADGLAGSESPIPPAVKVTSAVAPHRAVWPQGSNRPFADHPASDISAGAEKPKRPK